MRDIDDYHQFFYEWGAPLQIMDDIADATSTLQIRHGGGGFGFLSDMAWYPQIKFGVVWLSNSSEHDLQSWLTGQIVSDYIDANRRTLASRAYQSQPFTQKSFRSMKDDEAKR